MGEKETLEADIEKVVDDEFSIEPMQVNLHGMIPFYRNWYRDKLNGVEHEIHHNFMDILDYLVRKYVPEYDEAVGVEGSNSESLEEE